MISTGGKCWFTAAELADLALPGLPRQKRKVNERAADEFWAVKTDASGAPLARTRQGRGGGTEFHHSVLPAMAKAELVKRGIVFVSSETYSAGDAARPDESRIWFWFDQQSDKTRADAARRLAIVDQVTLLEEAGMTRSAAVSEISRAEAVSASTLWNWLALIDGVSPADRLPSLAPRRKGGGAESDVDAYVWQSLLSDYLRLSKPSWETCYRRAASIAAERGVTLPHSKTLFRKLEREVPVQVITLRREGNEAVRRMLPPQIRSVAHMHALEMVNIDGHKVDVFVRWPDGHIARPTVVAIQDIHSRKTVAWRVSETENMVVARLVFADLFSRWGIPKGLLSDNGRAFASKWLTGGAKTRFRFKIRDEDPTGLLVALGVKITWAQPYRGQSKPIERGFRDFCDAIAKHPAFEGAYTGNSPNAKPENYGNAAVDLETFIKVLDAGIAEHNARAGRRTEMCGGKLSFNQAFDASYAVAPIGKATDEQLRMALLAADQVSTDRSSGAVILGGNRYWSAELAQFAGQKVTVRYDPDDFTRAIHVYDRKGAYLLTAPLWEKTGFDNAEQAAERGRLERRWKKATREAEQALNLLSAAELVARLPEQPDVEPSVAPKVVRPVRPNIRNGRGQAAALKTISEGAQAPLNDQFMGQMSSAIGRLRLVE